MELAENNTFVKMPLQKRCQNSSLQFIFIQCKSCPWALTSKANYQAL